MIVGSYILAALWFFLPAGAGNAAPVLANKIPVLRDWKTPLDFGKNFRGKRILGDNKTWRGLLFGTLLAGLVGLLQYALVTHRVAGLWIEHIPILNFWAGSLLGLGALLGDALESFFKRQLGVASGNLWFPFDQIDYIVGGLMVSYFLVEISWQLVISIFVTWFGVHLVAVYLGYLLGLRDKPI